jgi:hypothetical protein
MIDGLAIKDAIRDNYRHAPTVNPTVGRRFYRKGCQGQTSPLGPPQSRFSFATSPGNHGEPASGFEPASNDQARVIVKTNHGVANSHCVDWLLLHSRLPLVGLTTTTLANHGGYFNSGVPGK